MSGRRRFKIVACGIFEEELRAIAATCPNELHVELLDAGLHSAPDRLRLQAQAAVDLASRRGGYDAVCFAYGLCGRGTAGLVARDIPLVLPRVHDCISLFLGSTRAYREQFARHPGTFYFTTGWHSKRAHPDQRRIAATRRFRPETDPRFAEYRERYGEDNARYLVEFFDSWRRNYTRAALIDHGFVTAEQVETTRAVADAAGWQYERIEGSLALLRDLAAGRWDEERFIIVQSGHVTVSAPEDGVFATAPAAGSDVAGPDGVPLRAGPAGRVPAGTFFYGEQTTRPGEGAELGLGIDAGGTYTDAVLFEFAAGRVLSKAKALTTHRNLADGIAGALAGLDASRLPRVAYTCLSTTLATNAIVEGRGQRVGLILMPCHEGAVAELKTPLRRLVSARMDIHGIEQAPVDEAEVLRAADELLAEGAASFAVSGYASVRNPAHELEVKRILLAQRGMPVVCGHELSARLNFVARAHTAVLNARLVPLICDLLEAVDRVLEQAGVRAPVFVVRGDGSIMRRDVARSRAIETVLSGPAASTAGGRLLTGCADALVADVGGTTTDIAVMQDGRVELTPDGARVGHWRTSVSAADIQTTGLGGDSAVRPGSRGRLRIGPERVVPVSCLAAGRPAVRDELARIVDGLAEGGAGPEALDFFVLAGNPEGLDLEGHERRIVELLDERPHSRAELGRLSGPAVPELLRIGRLEGIGLVRRSGPTPTDALHVLGRYRPVASWPRRSDAWPWPSCGAS